MSTEIAASAETVWGILTDLARYSEWNPFIRDARGAIRAGATLFVRVQPSMSRVRLIFRPRVLACAVPRRIEWRGRFLASWLGRGDHTFAIEPAGSGRVRFVQRETFAGLLPRLARRLLERETRRGFELMNAALKARCEAAQFAADRESWGGVRGIA